MNFPWLTIFGVVLTSLAVLTSLGMILFASSWQKLEVWAYGGAHRPWPVWVLAGLLLALWALGATEFALRPAASQHWAGWALAIGVPALWAIKSAALVFNTKGRAAVSSISEERSWRLIGLVRLPIAVALGWLTWLA